MIQYKTSKFKNYFTQSLRKNIKTISEAAEGLGYKMLNIDNEQQINIVEPQYAEQTFREMIENIVQIVQNQSLKQNLEKLYDNFVQSYVNSRERVILDSRNDKTFVMSIVKFQFCRKKTKCLLSYKISHFDYKCAPKVLKLTSESENKHCSRVLVFSSSSYSYKKTQRFVEVDRGVDERDIELLLQLSSIGSEKIDLQIQQFALK